MSVPAVSGPLPVLPTTAPLGPGAAAEITGTLGDGAQAAAFGSVLTSAVEGLTAAQNRAGALAVQAVTGELEDVHAYTIAATEAQVAMELTVAIRNKAVDAFNEIMRMQA